VIYVECKPDFALIKSLGIPKKNIIHAWGKSRVCRSLEKSSNSKGLIDEDPLSEQPPYLEKLHLIQERHEIRTWHDSRRGNCLVVLCPRLEEWILKAAKEAEIDLRRYNLPDDAEKLHKIINISINKFEKLIVELKGRSRIVKALEKSMKS